MTGDTIVHEGTAPTRPIRLVTTYKLERSRLMVFFRILLVLPHLVWLMIWRYAALLVGLINWVATLVTGRSPQVLHNFLAAFLRYSAHVNAFLFGAANEFPGFVGAAGSYPIDVHIDPPAPQARLKTFFRLFLAIPAFIVAGGVGFIGAAAAFLGWFASLFTGRMPAGLEHAIAYAIGYQVQTGGYLMLLTDRYPGSDPALVDGPASAPPHPVSLPVTDDLRRSPLTVFFRLLLVLPHFVWLELWAIAAVLLVILGWFAALFTGRLPAPIHRFVASYMRYSVHVNSYLMLLANPFPGFVPDDSRPYPVDLVVPEPEAQGRATVFFRLFLGIPALILSAAYGWALFPVAILGWFAGLFTGRMPEGLRNLGVAAQRYVAQYYSYAFLLTGRYPYAGPVS